MVKQLVKEGRLDLSVNGGWVMHDEANTHYTAMVDQTAYGHKFLKDEFNVTPRIGWQIDDFGHSATQGALLSAGIGLDALYFARIDYQDYETRREGQDLEFVWRPSKSRGKAMQVFTGEIMGHYTAPDKLNYGYDTGIRDTMGMPNVCDAVQHFVTICDGRARSTKGNNIFLPMGDDFSYQNAGMWFTNMDKLIVRGTSDCLQLDTN